MSDLSIELQEQIKYQIRNKQPFNITAGGSKAFYGQYADHQSELTEINVKGHRGIINYEPTELVLTARCGTPLSEITNQLDKNNQMLAFEPPSFSETATIGGCMATGLSGPRRPFTGAARDFTLGMRIINGEGEIARFGGEVMKNVAGYDVSRLMVGSLGTLGLILDISLKVLPKPEQEATVCYELTELAAINRVNKYFTQGIPMSASCYDGNRLYIRLSGTSAGVQNALQRLGGEQLEDDQDFWVSIREQTHPFFTTDQRLWRCSLAPGSAPFSISGDTLVEWRGAQRWIKSSEDIETVRNSIANLGGHATIFRHARIDDQVFHPVHGKLHELHLNLKLAMDPLCLFNPGRLYSDF